MIYDGKNNGPIFPHIQLSSNLFRIASDIKGATPISQNGVIVTITSHIFINILHTVHFSAVQFTSCYEKKYELSSDTIIYKRPDKI